MFFWEISKVKVEARKGCEFRRVCDDCHPLAEGETGILFVKTSQPFMLSL